ncbi:hypothetical protein HZB01_04925 [Candidatus Woesearchaeota archaeon]|nr:hypothetical protein [Candidatus Woesearchaeota archaeon]
MESFSLIMENTLSNSKEDFRIFLEKVFELYNGKLKPLKPLENIEGFSGKYRLHLANSPATAYCSFSPGFVQCISLSTQYHFLMAYKAKDYEVTTKQAEENFFEFINLAIAMMKASGNPFFVGTFFGPESPELMSPNKKNLIHLLFFKDKEYLPFLQKHVKYAFGVDVSLEELENIVKEYADIKKDYGKYKLICLYPFINPYPLHDSGSTRFYKRIKELKNE